MAETDYLMENVASLRKDLGKNNISQNLFQRFKELIISGQLPAGYMLPNENVVSEMLGVGRSTLREAYTALAVFGCLLGYESIAAEMGDPLLKTLVER